MEGNIMSDQTVQDIFFLRHAEGLHNVRKPHGPTAEIPLTDAGLEAVAQLKRKISEAGFMPKPDTIFVSPLLRTVQTAEGVKPLFPDVPVVFNDTHVEWANFDVQPGRLVSADYKQPLIDALWSRCDPNWIPHECGESFVVGESFAASVQRANRVKTELFSDNRNTILCVGHGFFIQTLALAMMNDYTATAETMHMSRDYEKLHNLDIVHVRHDRQTDTVTIEQRRFTENYMVTHPFPVKRDTKHDTIVLV